MREKVSLKITRQIIVAVICGLALIASSSTISVISTNKVDNNGKVGNRWEPTSAVGSTTWATGWTEICGSCMPVKDSYMSGWGGPWSTQFVLRTPGGVSLGDVNLAWDAVRGRFVFAALEIATPPPPQPSVWYGYSTDAHGTSWVVQTKVFSGTFSSAGWDYPSIGADASGHIIMGAVSELNSGCTMPPCANGYYSNISTDGIHFNASPSLVTSGVGTGAGAQSRVIATTTSLFHAFVPTLNNNNLPTKIIRWQSSNGTSWSNAQTVLTFGPPLNNSPPATSPVIFYAPLLTAQGFSDGRWTVSFQVANGTFSNAEQCASDRGCGMVNPAGTDEFVVGTGTSTDRGYWISYYTYSALPRTLPLITQTIYCPPGTSCIGATTNTGIDPTSWYFSSRCPPPSGPPSGGCYGAGDYQGIAAGITSGGLPGASNPFVKQSSLQTDLWQSFTQDPQGVPNVVNFVPNSIWVPLGSDISNIAGPPPPGTDLAYPPGHNVGVPDPISK